MIALGHGRQRRAKHLFDCWTTVRRRLRRARRVALFLDFDGTLVALRSHPDQVRLESSLRKLLHLLARCRKVTVSVISGRRRADIQKRINVPGVRYLGLYGWETEGDVFQTCASAGMVLRARRLLYDGPGKLPSIWVEDKGLSLAVHYRGAPSGAVRRARRMIGEILAPLKPQLQLLRGKKVWEVLPREITGKGGAVRELLAKHSRSTLPIYIGDDVSDESAFVQLRPGLTVRVGPARRSAARYRLRDPQEVRRFLERMVLEIT